VERFIIDVYPRLDRSRFNVRQVCLRERGPMADELERLGVPVQVCSMSSRHSPVGLRQLADLMRRQRIDIVHSHMYRANTSATIAAWMAGVPVVVTHIHNVGTWETHRQRWMDRLLARWRDAIVCVSEKVREDVLRTLRLPPPKVRVIYNGVDVARFSDRSQREPTRAALGLAPGEVAIIYVGRLVDQKNPMALAGIAEAVAGPRPGVKLIVAGDGPRRAGLEEHIRQRGLADRVLFLGRRDDVPALLQAADLAVLPSFKEGFSLVVLEALAAGLPLVATAVGGTPEAIEHGHSGVIVPPGDDAALVEAVARLVDNTDQRARMAGEAVRRAQRFNLKRTVADLEELYLKLAARHGLIDEARL
jgi:glycosyltransferase involved in cell wall biosynthesis